MSSAYDDLLNLPHHTSAVQPAMPMQNRAAQFAPFAALVGYDALIRETARLTDQKVELDESVKSRRSSTKNSGCFWSSCPSNRR